MPQNAAARVEAAQLMAVQQHMLSTKNGRPQIMPRQNHLLALNLMTKTERFLERDEFMSILTASVPTNSPLLLQVPPPAIRRPRHIWTARQLLSLILPAHVTLARGELDAKRLDHCDDFERTPTLIVRGEMLYGVVDKEISARVVTAIYTSAAVGNAAADDVNGQAPAACTRAAQAYVSAVSRFTEAWLEHHSGSMGVEDMMTDVAARGGVRAKCAACTADPARRAVFRSCVQCRLGCGDCRRLRAYFRARGKPFDIDAQSCGACYGGGKRAEECPLHRCATVLPRCRACRDVVEHGATFATHNVPDTVCDTARWPCDRALRRRLGPLKFAAWVACRDASAEFAAGLERQQRAWVERIGARPSDAMIDAFEARVRTTFAPAFEAAGADAQLALPAHAQRYANALARWQRVGPTKYAIERRLARVEGDVARIVAEKRATFRAEHKLHRYRTVDARIDDIEGAIRQTLAAARDETYALAYANLPRGNNLRDVIEAATKGNKTNVGTCIACVGPQEIDGGRLVDRVIGLEGGPETTTRLLAQPLRRYLPHDTSAYPGAEAGGFGAQSLMDGVSPRAFWMMAEASRDTLISTACRTAPVGYMTRKLCKTTEGVLVTGDGTVRNYDGTLVAQRYGAGYAVQFMQTKVLPPLTMSDVELAQCVLLDADADACTHDYRGARTEERWSLVWHETRRLREALDYLRSFGAVERQNVSEVRTVADIDRLLVEACYSGPGACARTACSVLLPFRRAAAPCWNACGVDDAARVAAWRRDIVAAQRAHFGVDVDEEFLLMDECDVIAVVGEWLTPRVRCTHPRCAAEHQHLEHCDDVTRAELRLRLCAKQLVRRHVICRQSLRYFMDAYAGWLRRATVVCGDAVAVDACQSFTSENMQGTLSSFHHAGATAVVVSEGMPRSLETLGARSTAKMATPKVTAHLPGGGYAARAQAQATAHVIAGLFSSSGEARAVAAAYAGAWARLGRGEHAARLATLGRRRPTTKEPVATVLRTKRKRALVAHAAAHAEELAEARATRRDQFGALVGEMLDVCAAAARQLTGETLGTLLVNWREADGALRADVVPDRLPAGASVGYVTLLVRYAFWDALAPLLGGDQLCAAEPIFDAERRWTGVWFRYVVPAGASSAHRAAAASFYRELRAAAAETYVFCPDRHRAGSLELFDEHYDELLAALARPQERIRERMAPGVAATSSDAVLGVQTTLDDVLSAPHRHGLTRPAFAELINSVAIVYAPLEPVPNDADALRVRVAGDAPAPFDEEIDTLYRELSVNNAIGCTHCRDGGDGRLYTAAGRVDTQARHVHARCEPDTRCLSSFVLELRLSSRSELAYEYHERIVPMLQEALGFDHSVLIGATISTADMLVHVRLHTCGLDRLTQRENMNHHADFCRPLLDGKLLREIVVTADDPGGDEPAPRARKTKAQLAATAAAAAVMAGGGGGATAASDGLSAIEDASLEKHIRRHMQRVLLGEVTRVERCRRDDTAEEAPTPRARVSTRLGERVYTLEEAVKLNARVQTRLSERAEARAAGKLTDTVKHQLTRCGELPTRAIYTDTRRPLIKLLTETDDDGGFVGNERTRFEISVATGKYDDDGRALVAGVERTFAQLQADEAEQITTQVEIAELHRSLELIKRLRLGTVDAEARAMCVERTPHFVVLPECGVVRRETPTVALDSRRFLRVINERFVDRRRSTTNAIFDIEQVLGKMAARNKTTSELGAIIRAVNAQVDRSHLALLASVQWCKGWCMPFTVHGLKYASDDVFQQMSFETTAVMLREAVTRRAVNSVVSPSTCIAFGIAVRRLGTSAIDLVYDVDARASERAYGAQESAESFAARNPLATQAAGDPFSRMRHLEPYAGASPGAETPSHNFGADVGSLSPPHDALLRADSMFAGLEQSGTNAFGRHAPTGACFSPPRHCEGDDAGHESDADDIFAELHAEQRLSAHEEYDPSRPGYAAAAPYAPLQSATAAVAASVNVESYDPERPAIGAPPALPFAAMYTNMLLAHQNLVADELSFIHN